ncbi:MAG: hypothetical protein SOY89_06385 [Dysosmobacter sp.]|nr:hypothetical protein [Dysosmobacter sp.]MDY3985162.1 hypothetical protein [Dysosmobacter sp.]
MTKKKMVPAQSRQYRLSSGPVSRGSRSRKARSRSYSTPRRAPSKMDWPNSSSWAET